MTAIFEVERTLEGEENECREWLVISLNNGWTSLHRDYQRHGKERQTDPESGIAIEDDILDRVIGALHGVSIGLRAAGSHGMTCPCPVCDAQTKALMAEIVKDDTDDSCPSSGQADPVKALSGLTWIAEIAHTIDYLVEAVERVTPSPDPHDPAEMSGDFYLGANIKRAKVLAKKLHGVSAPSRPGSSDDSRRAHEWLEKWSYADDDGPNLRGPLAELLAEVRRETVVDDPILKLAALLREAGLVPYLHGPCCATWHGGSCDMGCGP